MDIAELAASNSSPTEKESRNSTKRKSEETGQPPQRAKRNRYISIACNECKRRKIKCNGETPCQRCGNLSLQCIYSTNCCTGNFKESEEYKQMNAHISSLQKQVDSLYHNLNDIRSTNGSIAASVAGESYIQLRHERSGSQLSMDVHSPLETRSVSHQPPKHPRFQGPTSAAFSFGVAKSSLQTMGITAPEEQVEDGMMTQNDTPAVTPPPPPSAQIPGPMHISKDPIWSIDKEDALRMCRVYEDEMGMMYPILDISRIMKHVSMLYVFMDAAARSGLMQRALPGADAIMDEDTTVLKLVLAIASTLEGNGQSPLGKKLWDSVRPHVEKVPLEAPTLSGMQLLVLTSMFHFNRDDESGAWRIIGLVVRLCIELGLHQRSTYSTLFSSEEDRSAAVRLFWAVYCLDRRWSFGTGMPFALQDSDIDPSIPKPDETQPYLTAMIAYSSIGSKVWKSVATVDGVRPSINPEEVGYLDYQVIQWHRSIPDSLRYVHPSAGEEPPNGRGTARLRVILYMRANQMRILIYRPVLHSATSIMENSANAQTVVDLAKDTIRVLTHVNQTSDIYRTHQVCFNYFLVSALAVLFLAVAHAPAQFSTQCRDEFYMALDLVRGFAANSYVSKRLWRTIKMLREVGPKLGLNAGHQANGISTGNAQDAHSSAAVAMAGLAGHSMDEMSAYASNGGITKFESSPNRMANELTNMFEAAGGYSNGVVPSNHPTNGTNGASPSDGPNGANGTNGTNGYVAPMTNPNPPAGFGNEDELSRILRELF